MHERWRRRFFILVVSLAAGSLAVHIPSTAFAKSARVRDDGNNLRSKGGRDYRHAPILWVLNEGDHVHVHGVKEGWAEVTTPEGLDGWVHGKCLVDAPSVMKPQALPGDLRTRLEEFLLRLREVAKTREHRLVARLLSPDGVFIERRAFKDAFLSPGEQSQAIVPVWYVTDVSMTMGTAWELLIQGTNPPSSKFHWDSASESYRVGQAKGSESYDFDKVEGALAGYISALTLDTKALYVDGYPEEIEGYPQPESFAEDPRSVPFAWVFKVGKNRYKLLQQNRIGICLVVEDRPVEGLRLMALYTQSP